MASTTAAPGVSERGGEGLLEALLDSWDRSNTILLNLLRALPEGGLEARATAGGPCAAELFTHIHYVRLVFVLEDAPEFARKLPDREWVVESDPGRIAQMLGDSARAVHGQIKLALKASGRPLSDEKAGPVTWDVWMRRT